MKTLTALRNRSAVCLMLLGRKKVRNIKKKKSEEQVRASQIQKWS